MSTHRISLEIKVNIHVLSKSTGIIISVCARIAKTLQYCIGLQKNIFDPTNIEIMQIILGLSLIFFEIIFQCTWWPLVPYFYLGWLENVPTNIFWVKRARLSSCCDWDFRRLPNVAENVQRCSDDLKHLQSFWKAQF